MTNKINLGILVGSLRKESFSRKVANNFAKRFPDNYEISFIDLQDVEIYNQDLDDSNKPTAAWTKFRNEVEKQDAILFVTPEYNRSVPAVIKNALDVGSRPYGKNVWDHKPAAVISVSPGAISGFGANHHLRQSLVFLNMPTLQQPEAYFGNVVGILNEDGTITNEGTVKFIQSIVDSFVKWTEINKK